MKCKTRQQERTGGFESELNKADKNSKNYRNTKEIGKSYKNSKNNFY